MSSEDERASRKIIDEDEFKFRRNLRSLLKPSSRDEDPLKDYKEREDRVLWEPEAN